MQHAILLSSASNAPVILKLITAQYYDLRTRCLAEMTNSCTTLHISLHIDHHNYILYPVLFHEDGKLLCSVLPAHKLIGKTNSSLLLNSEFSSIPTFEVEATRPDSGYL